MTGLREQLTAGAHCFGVWSATSDSVAAEMLASTGFECVLLDAQHGGINNSNMAPLLQAVENGGAPGLVRVPELNQSDIMRALDLGAAGVVVPMVSNAAQAAAVASAMRYPPHGTRSFGRLRGGYYSADPTANEPLCLVMIETLEGMENLDAIAATEGIDGLFVGPVDLALALGHGPVLKLHDGVLEAVELIAAACHRHGKIAASAALGLDHAEALMKVGVKLIVQGSDIAFLRMGAISCIGQLKTLRDRNPA